MCFHGTVCFFPKAKGQSWLSSISLEQEVLQKSPWGITFAFLGSSHFQAAPSKEDSWLGTFQHSVEHLQPFVTVPSLYKCHLWSCSSCRHFVMAPNSLYKYSKSAHRLNKLENSWPRQWNYLSQEAQLVPLSINMGDLLRLLLFCLFILNIYIAALLLSISGPKAGKSNILKNDNRNVKIPDIQTLKTNPKTPFAPTSKMLGFAQAAPKLSNPGSQEG